MMKIKHDDDFRMFGLTLGHLLNIKKPYPFATTLLIEYLRGRTLWGMWCLAMLNERIVNPGDEPPLKTPLSKRKFLVKLMQISQNGRYAYRGIEFDQSKTVEDYYREIGPKDKPIGTGMEKLVTANSLRNLADKIERGEV
jgi:hypothetical protein